MKDLKAELEKLEVNAEDCELIARLAAEPSKRETFKRIAKQLRDMAAELRADIAARSEDMPQPHRQTPQQTKNANAS
jgi:SepF-like predicted cell division protein (DUF552 family)